MADISVDYQSIQLNFSNVIENLNKTAISHADKKNSAIQVENLAFKDSDGKFIGAGEFRIIAGMKNRDAEILPKKDFYDVLQEYTLWFCGKEEASYIKEDHLSPILASEDIGDSNQMSSETSATSSTETSSVSESFYSRTENNLLNMLFEAAPPVIDPDTDEEVSDEKKKENKNNEVSDGKSKQKTIGYSISYQIIVNGKKDYTLKDAIHQKSRGFFGAFLADLRNIKLIINGNPVNVGKWTDPAKLKELVGIRDIDINRVSDNVKFAMNHDFHNNNANVRVMTNSDGKDRGLINYLNRQGKLTPEIDSKLKKTKFSVVIEVNENDVNYPEYSQKTIAPTASKGFGTSDNKSGDWNKVGEADVIKIDDIENLYKTRSEYDQTQKVDVRDRESGGQKTPQSTKTSTPKATSNPTTKSKSTVTEKEEATKADSSDEKKNDKSSESNVKEDTELEKLVKSDEYRTFVNNTLKEQCSIELSEDEYTCSYDSTEDITNQMMQKGVNDLDLLRKIKNSGTQSYYVTITKNLKDTLNEELENEKNLLKMLFEDLDETEELLEEGDEDKKKRALDAAVDCINLTGDPKEDEQAKKSIKGNVHNILKKDKIELQIKNRVERVIKNTIIKTLDQFKTGRNFEEFDTDCFITSVEKKNIEESLKDFVRDYLNNLVESFATEAENGTRNEGVLPQKIKDMNSILVGRLTDVVEKGTTGWHVDPYCAITTPDRIIEYLKKHNIGSEKDYSEISKKPYCAMVLAKRTADIDGKHLIGGNGHEALTDAKVNSILDDVCGKENKLPVINCKNQNKDTMDSVKGDLIARTLMFYSEKNSKHENFVRNKEERHVPELDVWLRPFDLKDETTPRPEPIPPDLNITIIWFIVLPDPIPVPPKDKQKKTPQPTDHEEKDSPKIDWYIIPHKRLKDLGDRPHQETHYQDGVTVTKTSDDEYKP